MSGSGAEERHWKGMRYGHEPAPKDASVLQFAVEQFIQ